MLTIGEPCLFPNVGGPDKWSVSIDHHQIARPEILDPGRVQRDHFPDLCSLFVSLESITSRVVRSTSK